MDEIIVNIKYIQDFIWLDNEIHFLERSSNVIFALMSLQSVALLSMKISTWDSPLVKISASDFPLVKMITSNVLKRK